MSTLGHKQTFRSVHPMSALPPKADVAALPGGEEGHRDRQSHVLGPQCVNFTAHHHRESRLEV
jgi:hypothetical protein